MINNDMFGIILNSQKIICNTDKQIPKFNVEVYGGNPYMKGHNNFFTDVVYGNKCGSFKKYKEAFDACVKDGFLKYEDALETFLKDGHDIKLKDFGRIFSYDMITQTNYMVFDDIVVFNNAFERICTKKTGAIAAEYIMQELCVNMNQIVTIRPYKDNNVIDDKTYSILPDKWKSCSLSFNMLNMRS